MKNKNFRKLKYVLSILSKVGRYFEKVGGERRAK
jgi:hypothetical protein